MSKRLQLASQLASCCFANNTTRPSPPLRNSDASFMSFKLPSSLYHPFALLGLLAGVGGFRGRIRGRGKGGGGGGGSGRAHKLAHTTYQTKDNSQLLKSMFADKGDEAVCRLSRLFLSQSKSPPSHVDGAEAWPHWFDAMVGLRLRSASPFHTGRAQSLQLLFFSSHFLTTTFELFSSKSIRTNAA